MTKALKLLSLLVFCYSPQFYCYGMDSAIKSGSRDQPGAVMPRNIREALAILRDKKDAAEEKRIIGLLPRIPVLEHDDILALYAEAENREKDVPLAASNDRYEAYLRTALPFASRLRTCVDPSLRKDIADLLKKEYSSIRSDRRNPIPTLTLHGRISAALRAERVNSLIQAAGDGKNEEARAELWKIVELVGDGTYVQSSAESLGKMGNPNDLDKFIEILKVHPGYRIPLGGFGPMVVPRVLKELEDPNVARSAKDGLLPALAEAGSHDNILLYVNLMNHQDSSIAHVARHAVGSNLRADDDKLIRAMLENPFAEVRSNALVAVGEHAWKEEYGALLIERLRHDSDYSIRAIAAHYLGQHGSKAAIPALKEALKDSNPGVRSEAVSALQRISN